MSPVTTVRLETKLGSEPVIASIELLKILRFENPWHWPDTNIRSNLCEPSFVKMGCIASSKSIDPCQPARTA